MTTLCLIFTSALSGSGSAAISAISSNRPAQRITGRGTGRPGWAERRGRTLPRFPEVATVAESHQSLLGSGLDAVIITTPDHTHEEIIIDFLRGRHRCLRREAPGDQHRGCDRILEVARATGTRLYVGHNMRHMPVIATMQRLDDEGADRAGADRSGADTSSATAATTTSRTGTPTGPRRPACCCRRALTTSTSSTGSPARRAAGSLRWAHCSLRRHHRPQRTDRRGRSATGSIGNTTGRRGANAVSIRSSTSRTSR